MHFVVWLCPLLLSLLVTASLACLLCLRPMYSRPHLITPQQISKECFQVIHHERKQHSHRAVGEAVKKEKEKN